nr:orf106EGC118 [uncultured bacterium]
MALKQVRDQKKRLAGAWKCCDGFSDVVITIKVRAGKFTVSAIDKYDGEEPEIYDISWNEKQLELNFAVHWSSGRFIRYRFMPSVVPGRLELTYSFIGQELWERED